MRMTSTLSTCMHEACTFLRPVVSFGITPSLRIANVRRLDTSEDHHGLCHEEKDTFE